MKLYATLGIKPTATPEQIKAAYRKKSRENHPDHGGSTEAMAAVNDAYAVLSDPERRAIYDQTGATFKGPTLDEQATAALAQVFDSCLAEEGDIVALVRSAFDQGISEASAERQRMAAKLRKLEKRRGLVINTTGENLFQILLEGKIDQITKMRNQFEQQIEVAKAALRLLESYRFTGEVELPTTMTNQTFVDLIMSSASSRFR